MKQMMITMLFALAAGSAFSTGQDNNNLPPGANPPGGGHGCLNNPGIGCGPRPTPPAPPPAPVVPVSGTSNSSADAVAQAAALAAAQAAAQANATAIQNQNQNQNLSGSVSGTANTHGGHAPTYGGNATTTSGNAATQSGDITQSVNGSAGNNRLTTGDSSASSKSGVNNSGNSGANATGNGAGNVTTLSETTTYEAAKLPPQLPAVFLTMSAPCTGSAGGGAGSGVTVINLAFTYSDSECKEIRRITTMAGALWGMNMRYSAFTVLCSFQKFKEFVPTCSQPFPVDDPKQLWGYNPVDVVSDRGRAEKAEAELARMRQAPAAAAPLLSGVTKKDLEDLRAALAVRVEVPTDRVEKKRVRCKVEEFTDSAGQKVKMCRGPAGSYDVTTVTRETAVGTAKAEAKKQ